VKSAASKELRRENQLALDWLDQWEKTPNSATREWWEEFEQYLSEHPIIFDSTDCEFDLEHETLNLEPEPLNPGLETPYVSSPLQQHTHRI
jgi:hypothetical protein